MKHSGDLFSISVNETTNGKSVITRVAVTDSKILLHTSGKVRELPIGFDTKFEITVVKEENAKSKHLLKLFCQEQTYSFQLQASTAIVIRGRLAQCLSQKGFYQNIKPCKKVGKGNFGTVYYVKRISDGKEMAAKAFLKYNIGSIEYGNFLLQNQIQIMRKLNHPNILQIYQVYQTEHSVYVCVEYLHGGTLSRLIAQNKYQEAAVPVILEQLLDALAYMHSQGYMHRDIKTDNVMIREEGSLNCVLIDFGLATKSTADKLIFPRCGTPGYVAPQVINLQDLTKKYSEVCDVFSLGLIFYQLLVKKPAFANSHQKNVLKANKICEIDYTPLAKLSLSEAAIDLLKKMLQKNPDKRISAKQALLHPYLSRKLKRTTEMRSPMLGTRQLSRERSSSSFEKQAHQLSLTSCKEKPDPKKLTIQDSIGNFITLEKSVSIQNMEKQQQSVVRQNKNRVLFTLNQQAEEEDCSPKLRNKHSKSLKQQKDGSNAAQTKQSSLDPASELSKAKSFSHSRMRKEQTMQRQNLDSIVPSDMKREKAEYHQIYKAAARRVRKLVLTIPDGEEAVIQLLSSNPKVKVRQVF